MKTRTSSLTNLIIASILLAALSSANAAITLAGDFQNGAYGNHSITFTTDIVFNITTDGDLHYLIFDNWVSTNDGTSTRIIESDQVVQPIAYTLNGVSHSTDFGNLVDHLVDPYNDVNATSGVLRFVEIAVKSGDVLVFKAGTYILGNTPPEFNPELTGGYVFTGDVRVVDFFARAKATAIVPEPSSVLLGALGLLPLLRRRRNDLN